MLQTGVLLLRVCVASPVQDYSNTNVVFAAVRLGGVYTFLMQLKFSWACLRRMAEYALKFGVVTEAVQNDMLNYDRSMFVAVCDKEIYLCNCKQVVRRLGTNV
jgi:hypothetical protein